VSLADSYLLLSERRNMLCCNEGSVQQWPGMPVCKVSSAGAPDGASFPFIRSDPAEAIGLVDGRSRSEHSLMIMMSLTMPVLYQLILPIFADFASSYAYR
jgi:hypothetical protein